MSWFSDKLVGFGKKIVQGLSWVGNKAANLWNDFTGQTAVDKQNAANMELAKYQAQINEDYYNKYSSPEALMRQYREAGLNPNLVYGSASAGQSNVPGFNAPHVERSVTGSDKLNKALSVMSAVQGIMQGQYQTVAAREAAEQSALKTLDLETQVKRNRFDYDVESSTVGYSPDVFIKPFFNRSSLGRRRGSVTYDWSFDKNFRDTNLGLYSRAIREQRINKAAETVWGNFWNFGQMMDADYNPVKLDPYFTPLIKSKVKQADLNYQLDQELRKLGVYGRLGLAAAKLFF